MARLNLPIIRTLQSTSAQVLHQSTYTGLVIQNSDSVVCLQVAPGNDMGLAFTNTLARDVEVGLSGSVICQVE
jgi:hypothetical protein